MRLKLITLCGVCLPLAAGCALAGRRGPAPDDIAAARALSQQGLAAVQAGQWDQAETLLRKSVESSPADAVSRRYLAEALWRRDAFEDAIVQINAAVDADSKDAQLAVRAGEMLLATKSYELAALRADQAIRVDSKLAAAWALRGRAYLRMNQTERALADLQRALEYAPQDRDVLLDIAGIYQLIGQPTRRLTTLHQLMDTYPSGQKPQPLLLMEAMALKELGRGRQATESLRAASQVGPPSADVLSQLAQAHASMGEYDLATHAAQQALEVDASHIASRELLTRLTSPAALSEPVLR